MNCPKCGNVNNNSNFCVVCGENLQVMNTQVNSNASYPQQTNNIGTVSIYRPSNFVGCLVPFDIFIDGYLVGTVKNNCTTQIPVYYGTHTIEIKQGLNKSAIQQFIINDQSKIIYMNVTMNMGVFQNKLDIQIMGFNG